MGMAWGRRFRGEERSIRTVILVLGALALALAIGLVIVPGGPLYSVLRQGEEEVVAPQPSDEGPVEAVSPPTQQPSGGGARVSDTATTDESPQASRPFEAIVRPLEIIASVPKDSIPAVDNPTFVSASQADGLMKDTDRVIGLSIDGDHRAYSVAFLSRHEIVNDVVGGVPVAVTW